MMKPNLKGNLFIFAKKELMNRKRKLNICKH